MLYTRHCFKTLWKRQYRPSCSQPALLLGSPRSKFTLENSSRMQQFATFTFFCSEAYLEHCVSSNVSNHLSLWLFVGPKPTWLNSLKIERLMKITCLKLQRAPSDTGLAMTIAWMASAKAFQVSVELMGTTRFHRFHVGSHLMTENQVFNSELQCLLGSSQEEGKAYFLQKKYQEAWMILKKYRTKCTGFTWNWTCPLNVARRLDHVWHHVLISHWFIFSSCRGS